jgi:hypothetical protein
MDRIVGIKERILPSLFVLLILSIPVKFPPQLSLNGGRVASTCATFGAVKGELSVTGRLQACGSA